MRRFVIMCVLLGMMGVMPACAQQTVFLVPSADVTPKGRFHLDLENWFRPDGAEGYWLLNNYNNVGIGWNTELNLNVFNIRVPYNDSIHLSPGWKSSVPLKDIPIIKRWVKDPNFKWVGGSHMFIPLDDGKVGFWRYFMLSHRLPKVNTRLTGGLNIGSGVRYGRTAVGFTGLIEQPLGPRLAAAVSWTSGTHDVAYLIPGVLIRLGEQSRLEVGVLIPNNSRVGRQGFIVALKHTF
jgi:hypothetical protein